MSNNSTVRQRIQQYAVSGSCFAAAAALLLVLGGLAIFLSTHFYIKAYSDPGTWLRNGYLFEQHFGRQHLPLGYPAYLWIMIQLLGAVHVFLANIPLLILLFLLTGAAAFMAARRDASMKTNAAAAGISAMALLLTARPDLMVQMTNLYRDPLAHVLLLLSVALFVHYLRYSPRKPWVLGLSAWLLGCAYCVREPSLLMAAPMLLTGLLHHHRQGGPLRRDIPLFGILLAIGGLPLLLQTALSSNQVGISPYAAHHGRMLPGLHLIAFPRTFPAAWYFFTHGMRGIISALAFAGFLTAVIRKNLLISTLLFPGALMYFVFYVFYWNFFERYFFICILLLCPCAAYGLFAVLQAVLRRTVRRHRQPAVLWACILLLCGASAWHIIRTPAAEPRFSIPQAVRLRRDLRREMPGGSVLLCARHNLSKTIRAITLIPSFPLERALGTNALSDQAIGRLLEQLRKTHTGIYHLTDERHWENEVLSRYADHIAVRTLQAGDYNLEPFFGEPSLTLYRLSPRVHRGQVQVHLQHPETSAPILRIDPRTDPVKEQMALYLEDQRLAPVYSGGALYFQVATDALPPQITLTLTGEGLLPVEFPAVFLPADEPLDINLGFFSWPVHRYVWQRFPSQHYRIDERHAACSGNGTLLLPCPWKNTRRVKSTWLLRCSAPAKHPRHCRIGECDITVTADRKFRPYTATLAHTGNSPFIEVPLQISNGKDTAAPLEIDRIYLQPAGP